jgi:hypothetical protein
MSSKSQLNTINEILEEIMASDIKSVAKRNGLSEQEVETIIKEAGADMIKMDWRNNCLL